jgi:hypothetical protein
MLSKKEKGWHKPVPRNKHIICIEDPFDVEKDLGCYVDDNTIKDIRQVLAYYIPWTIGVRALVDMLLNIDKNQ